MKAFDYSFWEPLDEQYVADVASFARSHGLDYVSFNGSKPFFGYLDWSTQLDAAPYAQVSAQQNALVAKNENDHVATGTGFALFSAVGSPPGG